MWLALGYDLTPLRGRVRSGGLILTPMGESENMRERCVQTEKTSGEQNEPSGKITGASVFARGTFRSPSNPFSAGHEATVKGMTIFLARRLTRWSAKVAQKVNIT
jgi:hypothetical protein